MNERVDKLEKELNFAGKLRNNHDFVAKILPFFTREPERAKFSNGFEPVVGVIARNLNGKSSEFNQTEFEISKDDVEWQIDDKIVKKLFSTEMYSGMHSSKLFQYLPLSTGKERTGEIKIGEFLIGLLKLDSSEEFKNFFKNNSPENLYEKVVFDALRNSESDKVSSRTKFEYYDGANYFSKLFHQDVHNLSTDHDYFYSHIGALLELYYLIYVTQLMNRIGDSKVDRLISPIYFTVTDESVTQSRKAVKQGYNTIYQHGRDLLNDEDILNYLNILIPDDSRFYWKNEILAADFEYRTEIFFSLDQFIKDYAQKIGTDLTADELKYEDLDGAIAALSYLLELRRGAAESRYPKSFEAISKQDFSRRRGRLGKTFSLNTQTILMLTAVIVGNKKMLLEKVFEEFRKRGVYFDRITEGKITEIYEQANILEKLSDSGDAQYVRAIL